MENTKRGNELSPAVQREVLARFIYRWTRDNHQREACYAGIGKPTIPLISDEQWLARTEFHVRQDGTLDNRHRHCFHHFDEK